MALFTDRVDTKTASLSFKVYGDTPKELSMFVEDIREDANGVVLKLDREQCIEVVRVMINAAQQLRSA